VGSDRKVRSIESSDASADMSAGTAIVTQLCLPQPHPPNKDRLLFGGTETGVVKCWQLPLLEGKCYDHQTHTGAITRMRVSPDDNFLFTVGEDGCLSVFSIEHVCVLLHDRLHSCCIVD
jgi:WD40 repeat protein